MKKFIKNIFGFVLFALLMYLSLIFIWGTFFDARTNKNMNFKIGSNGHLYSRLKEIKKRKNIDILFVGSSHAYRSFDPRIFNQYDIKTFNLGSSSQTPMQTKLLLERYMNYLNPKLIVYEVYPATFSSDGVESAIDLISNSEIKYDIIKMVFQINHIKVYNTFIYSLLSKLFGLNNNFTENIKKGKDLYISGGYVERDDTLKNSIHLLQKQKWNLNPASLKIFEEIIVMLKLKARNYILIQTPITKSLFDSYINNKTIDNYFNQKGLYINFNNEISLNDSIDFYDNHHLNKVGVAKFNSIFINKLIKLNLIKSGKYFDRK